MNFFFQPKDIPVRFIKREVMEPPAAPASSEVMPSRLERAVFSYIPLPQAEMVVKDKPVTSLPSAVEVAEQILQVSVRELAKSNEQQNEEGAEKNAGSPLKVVEKTYQSKPVLKSVANLSSSHENSSNTPTKHQEQHSMETSQKGTFDFQLFAAV